MGSLSALRRVRDDLLATTSSGREWITLYERVQTPLLVPLLSDEQLGRRAAELVARAGELVLDEAAVLDEGTAEQALDLVARLADRSPSPGLRADLGAVTDQLRRATGRTSAEIVRGMMAAGPLREGPGGGGG